MRFARLVFAFCACQSAIPPGEIPPTPNAHATTSSTTKTFALRNLFLGEVDRIADTGSNTAWKVYGYDIDGHVTTRDSIDVCTLNAGAPHANQVDGVGGIDNAFGFVVLPIIQTGASIEKVSDNVSARIGVGEWTLEIQVTGLSDDATQTATGLSAQTFIGAKVSSPTFTETTDWPVLPSSLTDGASIAGGALVRFSTVYVTNGIVVARDATQPLVLPIQLSNATPTHQPPFATLVLRIRVPTITFDAATGANGTIAGVLDVQDAVSAAGPFAAELNESTCGSAFTGLADQIEQARDILVDGTNAPAVDCNAISIGLGFTASRVANPTTVGIDPPTPVDPCDAGAAD